GQTSGLYDWRMVDRSPLFIEAGLDANAGRAFVQERLALFGKTVFLLAFGFFAVVNGLVLVAGGLKMLPIPPTPAHVCHCLAASVMAAVCAIARGRPLSIRVLGALDAGGLIFAGIGLALMAAQPDVMQLLAGLLAITVTMMARAVLIPSTATR